MAHKMASTLKLSKVSRGTMEMNPDGEWVFTPAAPAVGTPARARLYLMRIRDVNKPATLSNMEWVALPPDTAMQINALIDGLPHDVLGEFPARATRAREAALPAIHVAIPSHAVQLSDKEVEVISDTTATLAVSSGMTEEEEREHWDFVTRAAMRTGMRYAQVSLDAFQEMDRRGIGDTGALRAAPAILAVARTAAEQAAQFAMQLARQAVQSAKMYAGCTSAPSGGGGGAAT